MDSIKSRVINEYKNNMNNNNNNNTKKNKKFLLCFRPMTTEGLDDPVFKYIAVEEEEGMFFPKILAPDKKEQEQEPEEEKGGGRRKKDRNVKLSRILKAVFTGTFLAKKLRKRKLRQSSFRSETNIATNGDKSLNSVNNNSMEQDVNNLSINSNVSSCSRCSAAFTSTTLCSSCSSSSASNSRSISQRCNSLRSNLIGSKQRQEDNDNNVQEHGKGRYGFYIGLCLPIISLLALICWGKVFAIFCTSMGFFLVSWRCRCDLPEDGIKSLEFDSNEYKKRIIMEGLLKRNRAHGV